LWQTCFSVEENPKEIKFKICEATKVMNAPTNDDVTTIDHDTFNLSTKWNIWTSTKIKTFRSQSSYPIPEADASFQKPPWCRPQTL